MEEITIKKYYVIPRFYYHRPPSGQLDFAKIGMGLRSYKNRGTDGSTPAIERAFKTKNPSIIWLSPRNDHGEAYIVDMSLLDENKLQPTGQAEGNIWHLGDIPVKAIVGYDHKAIYK